MKNLDDVTVLTYRDLESAGHGSRTTIWRKLKVGRFPEPDLENPPRWRTSTVAKHLDERQRLRGR